MENNLQSLKKDVRQITVNMFIYLAIFMGILAVFIIAGNVIIQLSQLIAIPEFLLQVAVNLEGFGYILGGTVALLVFYRRQKIAAKPIVHYHKRKMTVEWFVMLLIIMMSFQFIFNVAANGLEWILNQFGLSTMVAVESAQAQEDTLMMGLYAGFMGPIFEEFLTRGGILLRLKRYGKMVAIITSAMFFGFFHMNFIQGVFAFITGILLAFICLEFSFKWAIGFHILNNFGFGVVLVQGLFILFGESTTELLMQIIQVVCFVATLIILFFYRVEIKNYWKNNRSQPGTYRTIFSIISVWIFIAICIWLSLSGITPING